MAKTIAPRRNEKMIEFRVRFWTDGLAEAGRIRPKHAWSHGRVYTVVNQSHDIRPHDIPFNSLAELPLALEKLFIKAGVKLHSSSGRRMSKYLE